MRYDFVWDPAKARSNRAKHGVSFEIALAVFADPLLVTKPDTHHVDRWITVGEAKEQLLVVVHTDAETTSAQGRTQTIRIISARRATPQERRAYRNER